MIQGHLLANAIPSTSDNPSAATDPSLKLESSNARFDEESSLMPHFAHLQCCFDGSEN